MTSAFHNHILITGSPGCGKTTLVQKVCSLLKSKQISFEGFYTEEKRENGIRCGFDVIMLNKNMRFPLSHVPNSSCISRGPRVGRYIVDVKSFETAIKSLFDNMERNTKVLVIDEIGKMELFSRYFQDIVVKIFEESSKYIILATIPIARKQLPIVEKLCQLPTTKIITVTVDNRNNLPNEISQEIINKYFKIMN